MDPMLLMCTTLSSAASDGLNPGGARQDPWPLEEVAHRLPQSTVVAVSVEAGDTVCVLEAMKMENNIAAEAASTVAEVRVASGDSVGSSDIVAVIG